MRDLTKLIMCLVVSLATALQAFAANITVESKTPLDFLQEESDPAKLPCNYRLEGEIRAGDLDKLSPHVLSGNSVLCLNSQGGSLAEALQFIDFMYENSILTKLEANAECLSACAIIFLGGTRQWFEIGPKPSRAMHVSAKLGFHSPRLDVAQGIYTTESVTAAYNSALFSLSAAIGKLVMRIDELDGERWMEPLLLQALLETPADQMRYLEYVDDAALWKISVFPDIAQKPNIEALRQGCVNMLAWQKKKSAINLTNFVTPENLSVSEETSEFGARIITFSTGGMYESGCRFTDGEPDNRGSQYSAQLWNDINETVNMNMPDYQYLPANTRVSGLVPSKVSYAAEPTSKLRCMVIGGSGTVLDDERCSQSEVTTNGQRLMIFSWPSGSNTVISLPPQKVAVNDNDARLEPLREDMTCLRNKSSGNAFCFGR